MALPWLRVYSELLNSRKFHRLSDTLKARLVLIWCIAAKNDGSLPDLEDISFALRIAETDAEDTIEKLLVAGWLDRDENGTLAPHDWREHQYVSDISTGRVKRCREKKAALKHGDKIREPVSRNGSKTPVETRVKRRETVQEADSDSEQIQSRTETATAAKIAAACELAGKTSDLTDEERSEALNGNHTANGTSRKSLLNPELETALGNVAARIHARHPTLRRCGLGEIKNHLRGIARRAPPEKRLEALLQVDQNHAGWCDTPDWKKENGQYAKGLDNWMAPTKERWKEAPPVPDLPEDDGYRPAAEWDGIS